MCLTAFQLDAIFFFFYFNESFLALLRANVLTTLRKAAVHLFSLGFFLSEHTKL